MPNNPFTPESDQCQNSPAASQEIWHHTVWRTWLFIAYSDEKWLYYKFSRHHSYNRFLKGWENTLFELRSERVKQISGGMWRHPYDRVLLTSLFCPSGAGPQPLTQQAPALNQSEPKAPQASPKFQLQPHVFAQIQALTGECLIHVTCT